MNQARFWLIASGFWLSYARRMILIPIPGYMDYYLVDVIVNSQPLATNSDF